MFQYFNLGLLPLSVKGIQHTEEQSSDYVPIFKILVILGCDEKVVRKGFQIKLRKSQETHSSAVYGCKNCCIR